MEKRQIIPDAQAAAFLKHYRWLLRGKPREKLAYRIIEPQQEEIARLRCELDTLRGQKADAKTWADRVGSGE